MSRGSKTTDDKARLLVILSPGFPKDEEDSTCLPAQQSFVTTLNRLYPDLRIVILAFEYPFSKTPYEWHGNRVIPFNAWKKGKIKKLLTAFSAWNNLKRIRKEESILGLLNLWCTGPALIGNRFGRRYGIAHFTWILGQDARKRNRYIRLMRPRAGELVALSEILADEFDKNYGLRPEHMVPNGIDISLYPENLPAPDEESSQTVRIENLSAREEETRPASVTRKRDIDILGVGSLIPLKQYDLFLSVIAELSQRFPAIRAMICGKGPEEARLRAAIREKGLEDRVSLTGELPHEEVLKLMQHCRVFLHPSSYEGFSGVCLEALYAGAHVISFRRAMADPVEHWHIAKDREDMVELATGILQHHRTDHNPVLVYPMEESVQKMMQLFDPGLRPVRPGPGNQPGRPAE